MKSSKEIRRIRLQQLIDERFAGKPSALAKELKWESPSLIYAYTKGRKPIGDRLARKIETLSGPEYTYYLDSEGAAQYAKPAVGGLTTQATLEAQLINLFRGLSEDLQEQLLGRAHSLSVRQPVAQPAKAPIQLDDFRKRRAASRRPKKK